MKYFIVIITTFLLFSCKKTENTEKPKVVITENTGQQLFETTGNCTACHKPNEKSAGPSIAEISKIYKAKKGNMVAFLKGEAPAIVDPSQYAAMQINLEYTKTLSDEELKELEKYILKY